jgi:TolB protein
MRQTTRLDPIRRPLAGALACALVALAGGCGAVSRLSSAVFGAEDTHAVPPRVATAASTTPVPTAPAGANSSFAGQAGDGAPGSSAPLSGAAPAASRRNGRLVGLYGDVRRINDSALSEGGSNLSQVSFAAEGGDYAPDVDRSGKWMVFASTQHRPTFDVYRKSVDGRTVTQLTTDPSDDMMPSLSPDGTTIAFASNRNGNWDVFTMPITGGAPTQITSDADEEVQPTWAPDGRRLAFSRKNGRTGTWEIWIVDVTEPGVRTFVCEGFLPRWSPEASKDTLLFQRARQRGSRLYGVWTIDIVRGEGRNPTEVVSAKNAAILQPNWSPDGSQIVFTTVVNPDGGGEWPEQSDIWIVNADGTGRVGLTNSRFRNMQPAWGADGRIYFVSNRGGLENIWALSVDGLRSGAGAAQLAAELRGSGEAVAAGGTPAPAPAAPAAPAGTVTADATPDLLRSID